MSTRVSSPGSRQPHAPVGQRKHGNRAKGELRSDDRKAALYAAIQREVSAPTTSSATRSVGRAAASAKGSSKSVPAATKQTVDAARTGARPSRNLAAPAAWPCPPGQLNQPGCAPPQSVQRAADLTREVRKLALQLAATVTYGPLVTTMDNALFPDGLTADEASRLNKRFPGADHVLRLAASASPFAGFASNIPRADRERIATGVRNLALGFAARYYEHVGASDDANGIRYMMQQPYVPDGSIARIVRTTWEDANRK